MMLCSIFKFYSVIEKAENKRVLGVMNEQNRDVNIMNKGLGRQSNDLSIHEKRGVICLTLCIDCI